MSDLSCAANKKYPKLYRALKPLLRDDFFFINIGANDGVTNDPIYPFLLMYPEWDGVAVEPVPHTFERLQENYKAFPAVTLVNAAIMQGKKPFFYFPEDLAFDKRVASQISSCSKDYILKTLDVLSVIKPGLFEGLSGGGEALHEQIISDALIPCMTLDDLLDQYSIDRVDMLNIDAETADYDIFKMIDFSRIKPAVIFIETSEMTDDQKVCVHDTLLDKGYVYLQRFEVFSEVFILPEQGI